MIAKTAPTGNKTHSHKKLKSDILLLITALIWGTGFVAQSKGADALAPFSFTAFRYLLAFLSLLPVAVIFNKKFKKSEAADLGASGNCPNKGKQKKQRKELLFAGSATGIALFVATALQQYAMAFTTAAKAGFITTLYVVLVPVFGIFLGRKIRSFIWFCVFLAILGLYLLSIKPGTFSIGRGDFFVLLCAIAFTFHIMLIDHFASKVDGMMLSCFQFIVVSLFGFIAMFLFETLTLSALLEAIVPLLYSGVVCSAVAYTCQILGQRDADPAIASLMLSLESVFAAIAGMLILGESMSMRELAGCIIMFVAIICAQLPEKKNNTL